MRVTITIDNQLVEHVRQRFGGNLSKGINEILQGRLEKERTESTFGLLKGEGEALRKELKKMRKEEEKAHADLYR